MAVNYASGLSEYANKGRCGMPELFDDKDVVVSKARQLAEMIRVSEHCVVITGAGISTAAGIPDFRGPTGVWTLEKLGQRPNVNITFETAQPTVTHLALVALEQHGYVKFLISQNVDGLHLRSGFPRNRLAELHGNMFVEECGSCRTQYVRSEVVPTMTLQFTGGLCTQSKRRGKCRGRLKDTILDWEDSLPADELELSDKHCRAADLCLCLGTSLQILPCGNMPALTKRNGGQIAIVNLQSTRQDRCADLRVHARVDEVMMEVCKNLEILLPKWEQPCIVMKSVHTLPDEPSPRVVVDSSLLCKFTDVEHKDSMKLFSSSFVTEKKTI
jgi:mono-ADP-ribosyltransferase sirtuin 6